MSTLKFPSWGLGLNLIRFGHFVPGFTHFLQSFGVMGQMSKNELLYWPVHYSNREDDKSE